MRRREFIAAMGGAALAGPLAARAQHPAVPAIGYLNGATEAAERDFTAIFRQGLAEQGYVEGGMSKFYIDGRKRRTIACRRSPPI